MLPRGPSSTRPSGMAFLGDGSHRCLGPHQGLQGVPILHPPDPPTGASTPNHPDYLAIRGLMPRHCRRLSKAPRRIRPPPSRHRQIRQPQIRAPRIPRLLIHRFGVPNRIITNNGTQFTGRKFLDFYDAWHIWVDWASVYYTESNGQVERTNGMILQGIKTRINLVVWVSKEVNHIIRACLSTVIFNMSLN
jgi:hypothetical protein